MTLFPVVLPNSKEQDRLSRKELEAFLSSAARKALQISAEKSGLPLNEMHKDRDGAPLPSEGVFWSISHKPKYVAAVVSNAKIGIDIEEIKPRNESLLDYIASGNEWELSRNKSWSTFFRYWTAKEAVLKALGIGISGLKTCHIIAVPDDYHILLNYKGQSFQIEQVQHDNHIVSVTKNDTEIEWVILQELPF
jgi:4'-phosphopantetheinyl transferase